MYFLEKTKLLYYFIVSLQNFYLNLSEKFKVIPLILVSA